MSNQLNRRQFLGAAGAGFVALTSGCSDSKVNAVKQKTPAPTQEAADAALQTMLASTDSSNLVNVTGNTKFRIYDDQGNPQTVTLRDLAPKLAGKYTTMSFGVSGCMGLCPTINNHLKKITENNDNTHSLIVTVYPEGNGDSLASHREYQDYLKGFGVTADKTTLLYALNDNNELSGTVAKELQKRFNKSIANFASVGGHTANVTLFDPTGTQIDNKKIAKEVGANALEQTANSWNSIISGAGRSR